jgi:hypothetical protein
MKTLIASLLVVLAGVGSASAGGTYESLESGNTLLAKCVGPPELQLVCGGYTAAIYDTIAMLEAGGAVPKHHCFPPDVTRLQIRDVIVRYLQGHPAERHTGAASLASDALQEAWPCNR